MANPSIRLRWLFEERMALAYAPTENAFAQRWATGSHPRRGILPAIRRAGRATTATSVSEPQAVPKRDSVWCFYDTPALSGLRFARARAVLAWARNLQGRPRRCIASRCR
jgi:hypothetical protein